MTITKRGFTNRKKPKIKDMQKEKISTSKYGKAFHSQPCKGKKVNNSTPKKSKRKRKKKKGSPPNTL